MSNNDSTLTAERLRELLTYDQKSGVFTWRISPAKNISAGSRAGCRKNIGYRDLSVDKKQYREHRLVFLYINGVWPIGDIDHINGDRSDNRLDNLREVTPGENMQNLYRARNRSKSKYLGVVQNKSGNGFRAVIGLNKKQIYLGTFTTAEIAYEAYVNGKRIFHPCGML